MPRKGGRRLRCAVAVVAVALAASAFSVAVAPAAAADPATVQMIGDARCAIPSYIPTPSLPGPCDSVNVTYTFADGTRHYRSGHIELSPCGRRT